MPFFTVYKVATGEEVSSTHSRQGLATAAQLASRGLDFKEQPNPPDLATEMWDPATLAYIPRPPRPLTRQEELAAKVAGPGGRIYTEEERDEIFKLLIGGTL